MPALLATARRSIWLSWLIDNPLLIREIRRRMRGRLFTWSLIGYLAALGGVSCVLMYTTYPFHSELRPARDMIQEVGRIGATLFRGMCFVEGVIALFLAPMLTAGLATAEKEKDTFDFLRVTTLRSRTFVSGCLLTTACFLFLVFTCTLPILGLTFIFGGVSMQEIMTFNLILFLVAMAVSAWGIFNSTNYKRSRSVQGSIFILFIIALFLGSRVWFFLGAGFVRTSVFGTGAVASALVTVVPILLIILVFSVAAARRLYEPNNRMFNYKQYTIFFIVGLGFVGGSLAYRIYGASAKALGTDEVLVGLNFYFLLGWLLTTIGILFFSTGRTEKGDEVWRLRFGRKIFQRLDERIPLYALYIALWLGSAYLLADAWDSTGKFTTHFMSTLPLALLSLVLVQAVASCLSLFSENRNRVMVAVVLGLVVLWGVIPAFGYFLGEIRTNPSRRSQSAAMQGASEILMDVSPIRVVNHIWRDETDTDPTLSLIFLSALSLLFILPTFSKKLRGRFAVTYDWVSKRPVEEDAVAASPVG